ncbi:MAG: VPS10 domain-containing protein, partial [Myxococcales bacterium]
AGVISGLNARNIGSAAMSGRISAIAGRNLDGKSLLYVGAASGGVWKSQDGGTTFKPVFDKQPVQSIGAIAIDPKNPEVVWVGTGESWVRNSVSIGDGVYRTADGGESWTHMGLPKSERITRIVIDPRSSDVVYACAPGKLWSDSPDRGLYKTTDGGKSWDLILTGPNLSTGCSTVAMDPKNPDVLFAGLWDFRRKGWTFRSGGDTPEAPSGSALFRSADGGAHWTELSSVGGKKPWGRVEVAVAPGNSSVVYAFVESTASALWRSGDGGNTWERRDDSQWMVWRPFYFARLIVDPTNPDRLFKTDGALIASDDGGKSFTQVGGFGSTHGDWHDLWLDPENPKHIVGGNDGGLFISFDGGNRWWKNNNLPVSQFYHVAVDGRDPYRVYGGLQDNSTFTAPSAYGGGISNSVWENLYGGDGFWAIPDPTDPEAVYAEAQGGFIGRVDRRLQIARDIQPKANYKERLRYNWNTPLHASPTQKGTLYIGAQFLFRSHDRGDTWERISPDLTTDDKEKQKYEESGGVTLDNSSAEEHTTIYSISESPLDANTIWVGTDDGNLQLTRDAGKKWTNLIGNVRGLPPASWVSWVEASRFDPGTAYAAFDRHTFGDMTPWVYRTADFGKTWTRIVAPEQGVKGYAHVVKEDPVRKDLLYVGTELGLFISVDGGKSWAEFKGNDFPAVAVRDLQIHPRDGDLIMATHGRGIWIIDDLTPLRALSQQALSQEAGFLPWRPTQQRISGQGGWAEGDATFVGQNPASGAVITYYQRTRHLFGPIKLEIVDAQGNVVDSVPASKRRGINRVVWNMQVKPPRVPRAAAVAFAGSQGPRVVPGTYTVRLTKGAHVYQTKLEIGLDRRAPWNLADRRAQFESAMQAHALFGEMSDLVDRIDAAAGALSQRMKAQPGNAQLTALAGKVEAAKKKIVATKEGGAITGEERIREHTDHLYAALLSWEGKPARYLMARTEALRRELGDVRAEFEALQPQIHAMEIRVEPVRAISQVAERCAASRGERCGARSAGAAE